MRRSGARYVVFVTKHHDGFSLWPTTVRHPRRSGWHTSRDCVSELAQAVRSEGMRFGIYYSGGVDWSVQFEPGRSVGDFLAFTPTSAAYASYAEAQVRELIDLVSPDVIWNDIAWPTSQDRVNRLFDDYYRKVPEGVVNDRWGTPSVLSRALRVRAFRRVFDAVGERWVRRRGVNLVYPVPPRCDFRTPEYAELDASERMKWEATRGMGHSFAYNREETDEKLLSVEELRAERDRILGKGGNLLLNIGPRGEDATIPPEQVKRLRALGDVPFARAVGF